MAFVTSVGCYNVLINSPNIQLSTEVGKLRVDTKYMRGRGVPRVSWKYFNKENIKISFKMKNRVKLLRLSQ